MAVPEIKLVSTPSADNVSLPADKFKKIESKCGTIIVDKNLWKNFVSDDGADDIIELSNGVKISLSSPPYDEKGELIISFSNPIFGGKNGINFSIKGMSIDINSKNSEKDNLFLNTEKSMVYVSGDKNDTTTVLNNNDSSIWVH